MSVVVMSVFFANSDNIVIMMVMSVDNIIFINNVVSVIDYMTIPDNPAVFGTVKFPSFKRSYVADGFLDIVTSVVPVANHFFLPFVNLFLVSINSDSFR